MAHLTLPNDLQVAKAGAEPVCRGWPGPAAVHRADPARRPGRPREEDLQRLADVLNGGEKIAILAGAGALHARQELLAVAETLGAMIIKTLPGKATVPDDSPYTTGGIGLLGTAPSEELMDDIDTLFMVGTNFPYTKFMPEPGKTRIVQIEADPARAGSRVPTEVPVVGDAREGLAALLPLLKQRSDTSFLEKYQKQMDKWRGKMAALQNADRDPIAPQYLVSVLDELAAEDAVLTCDSGTIATWAARHWHIRGGRQFYLSGNLATMAPGLPYAIGIQHAFPGRQVIGYVGDGGFSMLMAEFITAIQHKLPVKIVINNNNSLGQILWEQMVLGYPENGVRYPEPPVNYTALATANGALGIKVTNPAELRNAIGQALEPRRARPGGRGRQPERAATARQDRVPAGQELRRGVPARPAAQGDDRDHPVPGQDRAVPRLTAWLGPAVSARPGPGVPAPAGPGRAAPGSAAARTAA